jgi:hypothetical protein
LAHGPCSGLEARGRGHVVHLIQTIEAACRSASIPVVWLYAVPSACTRVLDGVAWKLYSVVAGGRSLMRRDLS